MLPMLRIGAHAARQLRRFASLAERIAHDADEAGPHATLRTRRCARCGRAIVTAFVRGLRVWMSARAIWLQAVCGAQ
ncbi:hypothetical protein LVB77_12525 [Lysobacter sp. 5GHs7-4]|uniref:hypothetical protein n=1 Tax=Lysobacter sp. 5GHs7-4 TaxID=2904253 RepID=UPI001E4FE505|nr:hypothetical protein [Lysobacter sp. 5GHs7-4]UHQ21508.1 hypothetical protein LVB77_12525 [Lysobacter sp. 5GHs7-4]